MLKFCNTANKAGKAIQKSAPAAQQKQKRLGSDDDFIVGEDDEEEDGTLKQKRKAKKTAPMKRTSDNPESDDDIRPVKHKKKKQISSESDEESLPLQTAKKQHPVKPAEPVLRDESSGSDEDVKPAAAKVCHTSDRIEIILSRTVNSHLADTSLLRTPL